MSEYNDTRRRREVQARMKRAYKRMNTALEAGDILAAQRAYSDVWILAAAARSRPIWVRGGFKPL